MTDIKFHTDTLEDDIRMSHKAQLLASIVQVLDDNFPDNPTITFLNDVLFMALAPIDAGEVSAHAIAKIILGKAGITE